jgi:hypothetical protein
MDADRNAHHEWFGCAAMKILVTGGGGRAAHALAMRRIASPMRREAETGMSMGGRSKDGSEPT